MKKILILMLLVMAVATGADAQLRWGVEGSAKYSLTARTCDRSGGFTIGGYGEYQFAKNWYVDFGLRLSLDAWKMRGESYPDWIFLKYRASAYSLQLPVHIGYRFGITDNVKLFAAVGAYIGRGMWGDGHLTHRYNEEGGYEYYGEKDSDIYRYYMHRSQVGMEARIGTELWNKVPVFINVNYQFNNVSKLPLPNDKHLKYIALGFGYKF